MKIKIPMIDSNGNLDIPGNLEAKIDGLRENYCGC